MKRSFYAPRSSGLHSLHPLTKLTLSAVLLWIGLISSAAWIAFAIWVAIIIPISLWGRIARQLVRDALLLTLPFLVSLLLVQGLFLPGAAQVLVSLGPLSLKAEGITFALAATARILLLASCGLVLLLSTAPSDLMLALAQRGFPASLSYIVLTAIQLLPQMQAKAQSISEAQRSRGLETEGSILTRLASLIPLVGPLISSSLLDVDERAAALEVRAFSSTRGKTSYRELSDTRGQHLLRLTMVLIALIWTVVQMGERFR